MSIFFSRAFPTRAPSATREVYAALKWQLAQMLRFEVEAETLVRLLVSSSFGSGSGRNPVLELAWEPVVLFRLSAGIASAMELGEFRSCEAS